MRAATVAAMVSLTTLAVAAQTPAAAQQPGTDAANPTAATSAEQERARYARYSANGRGAEIAALKRALDPEERPVATAEERARIAKKDAAAEQHFRATTAESDFSVQAESGWLPITHQTQQTGYWCGPAVVSMILNGHNRGIGQDQAARELETTAADGTVWSKFRFGSRFYPVRDVLNRHLNSTWYEAKALPDWPGWIEHDRFMYDVKFNIDRGYYLAGDAYEATPEYRLNNHPTDRTIWHWFAIYSYYHNANTITYADSAAYQSGGFERVTPYNAIDSLKATIIMGGRGYVA